LTTVYPYPPLAHRGPNQGT